MKKGIEFVELLKKLEKEIYDEEKDNDSIDESNFDEDQLEQFKNEEKEILEEIDKNFNELSKIRKYKLLYFLYGWCINIGDMENDFFVNDENYKWYAFKNGPILNTYNSNGADKEILINYYDMNIAQKKILLLGYMAIRNYSTSKLIEKSHKTAPWENNWKIGSYYSEIPKDEIVHYFKNNFMDIKKK